MTSRHPIVPAAIQRPPLVTIHYYRYVTGIQAKGAVNG
jgi:hypothetical protein